MFVWRCNCAKSYATCAVRHGSFPPLPHPLPPSRAPKARARWWPLWWPLVVFGCPFWCPSSVSRLSRPSSRPRWGPIRASAQASPVPCQSTAPPSLHHEPLLLLPSPSHRRSSPPPTPTPTPRRWRAQLSSRCRCRCYSSPATVIQVAFLPEPPSRSSFILALANRDPASERQHQQELSLPESTPPATTLTILCEIEIFYVPWIKTPAILGGLHFSPFVLP